MAGDDSRIDFVITVHVMLGLGSPPAELRECCCGSMLNIELEKYTGKQQVDSFMNNILLLFLHFS